MLAGRSRSPSPRSWPSWPAAAQTAAPNRGWRGGFAGDGPSGPSAPCMPARRRASYATREAGGCTGLRLPWSVGQAKALSRSVGDEFPIAEASPSHLFSLGFPPIADKEKSRITRRSRRGDPPFSLPLVDACVRQGRLGCASGREGQPGKEAAARVKVLKPGTGA